MKKKQRSLWVALALVGLLTVGSIALLATGTRPVLGLDLEGGVSVILSAPDGTPDTVMNQALENIRNRIDAFGTAEPLLFVTGNTIEVQIPGLARGRSRSGRSSSRASPTMRGTSIPVSARRTPPTRSSAPSAFDPSCRRYA